MDARLKTVTRMIRSPVHVDIGSDHAKLLKSLLRSGRIQRGIAIENKRQPWENSRRGLWQLAADVRFGDGLAVLAEGEADSLSICGMGASAIVKILNAFPERVPPHVVLQPNRQAELIRQWAWQANYHIIDEQIAHGHWPYEILSMRGAVGVAAGIVADPAYEGLDHDVAIAIGPMILRRRDPALVDRLREEHVYLSQFKALTPSSALRLRLIRQVLEWSTEPT